MTHSSGPWKHPKRAPIILTPEDDNRGERMLGLFLALMIAGLAFLTVGIFLAWIT